MTDLANKMTADHDNAASEKQVILYTPSEIAKIAHNEAMVHMTRSPWEQRVGSAPMAIAAMGLLRCLVVGNDFSINDSKPIASAFTLAQTNMNKIIHKSKNVNDNILVLFTVLSEGDMEMVREMLPGALGPVSDDAKNCRKLADEVTAQFGKVKALTEEVEQACLAEQSASATKLTQVKKGTAINQTAVEQLNRELNQHPDKLKAFYDAATQLNEEQSRVVEAVAKCKESVEGILGMAIDKEYEAWESRVHRSHEDYKTLRAEYAEQLKELEELEEMQAHNAELLKSIVQGHSEVSNLTEIVKLPKEGVQALGRLQVHWVNLSLYFQDLADIVDACNTKVETLAKQASVMANKRLTSGDQLPVAYQKLLYGYCVRADALSRVVGAVSTMYVGVSEDDLQPLLMRLGKANELDKKEDIKDFARQLELEALKVQGTIVEKLTESKEQYMKNALESKDANALIYKGHY
ncbi:hypothetical protein GGF32_004742 [Allomyces javanicus]|nr:hypothetical protein GGF32_004742 [Allomyces javanicus]